MLVIIPIFAGLLACMPVPVGDPERSRIDPELSGVWAMTEGGADSGNYLFRPYDKRTWLVVGVEASDSGTAQVYKAWVTKLGGEQFLTWEQAGGFKKDGRVQPDFWYVFRVEKNAADEVMLRMLDYEFSGFEDIPGPDGYEGNYVKDQRRSFERVIKKNVNNEDMYGDALTMRRLTVDELPEASERFEKVVAFD
jgi:hypothetical protein